MAHAPAVALPNQAIHHHPSATIDKPASAPSRPTSKATRHTTWHWHWHLVGAARRVATVNPAHRYRVNPAVHVPRVEKDPAARLQAPIATTPHKPGAFCPYRLLPGIWDLITRRKGLLTFASSHSQIWASGGPRGLGSVRGGFWCFLGGGRGKSTARRRGIGW